jgi:hypothetical protein
VSDPRKRVEIEVTTENVWFLERYLGVFDFSELFPSDAFGTDDQRGVPVILHTDCGFSIETDIDRPKMQLRNRSRLRGWTRWTDEKNLQPNDRIIVERIAARDYQLTLERTDLSTPSTTPSC